MPCCRLVFGLFYLSSGLSLTEAFFCYPLFDMKPDLLYEKNKCLNQNSFKMDHVGLY